LAEATQKAKNLHRRQQLPNSMVGQNLVRLVDFQG
jgi:hypothetical protein